jgi:hypothetical protein
MCNTGEVAVLVVDGTQLVSEVRPRVLAAA